MAKVSIIVPIYNSEKTIGSCIEAILEQDYKDFELLLCDDGSKDCSLAVCGRYAAADKRIRVLALPHRGVSAARNAGLSNACGKYILFADSDDMPSINWVSFLVAHMAPKSLALCGYSCVNEEGVRLYGAEKQDEQWIEGMHIETDRFIMDLFSNCHMYQGYIWNKIFDASLICEHRIRFDEGIAFNEDRLFLFNYLLFCRAVNYSNIPLYTYALHNIYSSHTKQEKAYEECLFTEIEAFEMMCEELERRKMVSAYQFARKDELRALNDLISLARKECHRDLAKLEHLESELRSEQQRREQKNQKQKCEGQRPVERQPARFVSAQA